MGVREFFLLHLLPGVELLIRAEQYILVPQLIHRHSSLGPDDGVDTPHLIGNLPGALKAPAVVITEVCTVVPVSIVG